MTKCKLVWLTALIGLGGLFLALFLLTHKQTDPVQTSVAVAAPPSANPAREQVPTANPLREEVKAETAPREQVIDTIGGGDKLVRIQPGQVLATVNGVSITLRDLVPLSKEKAGNEQVMSADMYEYLFNRAVDRELTLQAARASGVELTPEQQQRLAEFRARSEQREPGVFDSMQQNPDNTEFEQRDFAGLLLQHSLATKAGLASPYVTAAMVEEHFQAHQADYDQLPKEPEQRQVAWRRIELEIRQKLSGRLQSEYDLGLRKFLDRLKSEAKITIKPPIS